MKYYCDVKMVSKTLSGKVITRVEILERVKEVIGEVAIVQRME